METVNLNAPVDTNLITLTRHVMHEQAELGSTATGALTMLLTSIQLGAKFVASSVRRAGLAHLTGLAGCVNVQGEQVQKLDVLSNEIFINSLKSSGKTAVLVSEENEHAIFVEDSLRGRYCVVFDPLDGSSNIDAGVSVGSIFGIFKVRNGSHGDLVDVLRPGREMIAAGYALYGSSTSLVLSTGKGVNGYTLDPSLGEFILTHKNIRIPSKGNIYSMNEGNSPYWDEPTTKYIHSIKYPSVEKSASYSLRYIGSMVADVHRTLLYGGIFAYPGSKTSPKGKLRLLYECFPMAYIIEQAGGMAVNGCEDILDIVPQTIHERSPIFLGSPEDVQNVKRWYTV